MDNSRQEDLPKLIITDDSLITILDSINTSETLIVTNSNYYEELQHHYQCIQVQNNDIKQIKPARQKYHFKKVIGVGGGTCHDMARLIAGTHPYILVSTILSTSCIAVNNAVPSYYGRNRLIKTASPQQSIVCMKEILSLPYDQLSRWNHSGIGDLLSGISAAMDVVYRKNLPLTTIAIKQLAPHYFAIIKWLLNDFSEWDKMAVKLLAEHEYISSINVIKAGNATLSCGNEHLFYNELVYRYPSLRYNGPRHGEIVYAGSLISAKLFAKMTGDETIYSLLQAVGKKLQMPYHYSLLNQIGLTKEILIQSLIYTCRYQSKGVLCEQLPQYSIPQLLDEVFELK